MQLCNSHNHLEGEHIMPEVIKKSSIIGRSPKGVAVLAFENEALLELWLAKNTTHRMKFYKQTITEEEIEICPKELSQEG